MIQRKQSLFLLFASALHALMFLFPIYTFKSATGEYTEEVFLNTWQGIFNLLIITVLLGTIFLYKNRIIQLRITRLTIALQCIFIALLFYFTQTSATPLNDLQLKGNYDIGIMMPFLAAILVFLAGRGILQDERLVRSADRLR